MIVLKILRFAVFWVCIGVATGELGDPSEHPPRLVELTNKQKQVALDLWQPYVENDLVRDIQAGDYGSIRKLLLVVSDDTVRFDVEHEKRADWMREAVILAINENPGYAHFVQGKIQLASDDFREGRLDAASYVWLVGTEVKYLSDLPLHDSVVVICSYLGDRSKDVPPLSNGLQPPNRKISNAELAVRALKRLPLVDPPDPFGPTKYPIEPYLMIDHWVKWWAEVEAGERTFRFTDHPAIYSAQGVVRYAPLGQPDKPRSAVLERKLLTPPEKSRDGSSRWPRLMVVVVGLLVVVTAFWSFGWWRGGKGKWVSGSKV